MREEPDAPELEIIHDGQDLFIVVDGVRGWRRCSDQGTA
jgi:hypothetical protein